MKANTDWKLISCLTFTTIFAAAAFAQTNGFPGGTNGPLVTIRALDASASETGDTGWFRVSRGDSSNGNLVVWLRITGTALNGVDYQSISNRVLIPEGARSADITVTPIDDVIPEPNESVLLRVIAPPVVTLDSIYRIGSPNSASILIEDNDGFVESNRPPTVSIIQPTNNAMFAAPTLIVIRAEADDSDGIVASVEFFANEQSLGFSRNANTNNLFTLAWSNAPAGEFNLKARATDNGGASSFSAPMHITVRTNPPSPTCVRPPEGLVGWWPLNTNGVDLVTGHQAELQNGPEFVPGQVGGALRFDGVDDTVRILASPALDVGAADGMTIELWVNPDDISRTEPLVEWNNGVDLFGAHLWVMANQPGAGLQPPSSAVAGPGQIYAAFNLTGQWHQMVTDAGTLVPQAFQHVALTYSKSSGIGRIYRNGVLVAEQTLGTFRPQTDLDVYLGRRPAAPTGDPLVSFHGILDEPAIYNRALDSAEIAAIYTTGTAGKCHPATELSFDLSRDYSLAANPNGPWSYGYLTSLDGTFGLLQAARTFGADNGVAIGVWELNTYQLPIVAKVLGPGEAHSDGDHFTAPPGTIYFAPGADGASQNFGVIRFTVPPGGGGVYRLETAVRSLFDNTRSRDADFHVVQNGHELFGRFLAPNSGTSYSNVLTLAPGDTLDFAIGRGADGLTADTGLKIQATLALVTNGPPPETNQLPVISITATDPTAAEGVVMWCSNTVFGVNSNWFDPVWRRNCPHPTGTNTALFTVRRTGATDEPLSVYYSIGGTASNGLDYASLPGVVTISAGRRTAEIRILPIDDNIPERIETVVLRLHPPLTSNDIPYTLGRSVSAAAYITDNDQPPPPCGRLDEGTVHLCVPFTNQCFRLEISTNLVHWEGVCTNAIADGAAHYLDPDAVTRPHQFIRFIPVPCPPDGE